MTTTTTAASLARPKVLDVGVASVFVELGFVIAPVSVEPGFVIASVSMVTILAVLRRKKEITRGPEPRCSPQAEPCKKMRRRVRPAQNSAAEILKAMR
jgi:hypothetical protein